MNEFPFTEIVNENFIIREFSKNTKQEELEWHTDAEDRLIIPINESFWKLQIDDCLPIFLKKNEKYYIPNGVYHRLIKDNDGSLKVKLYKNIKPKESSYIEISIEECIAYHYENDISFVTPEIRIGSDLWIRCINTLRILDEKYKLPILKEDKKLINFTDVGKCVKYKNEKIYLDIPFKDTDNKIYMFSLDNKKLKKINIK